MASVRIFGAAKIAVGAVAAGAFVTGAVAAGETAGADAFFLQRTFEDPVPGENDGIGLAIAMDGDRLLVGMAWDDTNGVDAGQAHLFDAETGALLMTFEDPTPAAGDGFGSSVALEGGFVLIAAHGDDTSGTDVGQAHLFDIETGALLMTFEDPTPTNADRFGRPLALDGSLALVGAAGDDTNGNDVGQAYLFDVATGALLHTLDEPTPTHLSRFGTSVAIGGGRVLIGADLDDTDGDNVGQAHLFDAGTGELLLNLADPTPTRNGSFGISVALAGRHALVGARWDSTNANNAGQAYLFDAATGELLITFDEPSPTPDHEFGASVALDGDRALISALWNDTGAANVGRVYLFDIGTGSLMHTFDNPTPTDYDVFGHAMAVDGDRVAIGASGADAEFDNMGRVYLFIGATGEP